LHGKKAILCISPINLLPLIAQACEDKITAVGWLDAGTAISDNEREHHDVGTYEQIILLLGETEYQALSPEDKCVVNLFIHAGCCMHKEMNSAQEGNFCMMWMWSKAVGPIKLMNMVWHRYRKTSGFSKTGSTGMGTVVDFGTLWHTLYPYCSIVGML
jgi:hypothetical protein